MVLTPSRSGYTHTCHHSPGCHCPVTSNQQHEPLLAFNLTTSMIFFVLENTPLAMPKAPYLSMESVPISILGYIKTSFSVCTLTDLTTIPYSSLECVSTPTHQHPVLPIIRLSQALRLHSLLECFQTLTVGTTPGPRDDENFDHLSERILLCNTPHWVPNYVTVF